MGSWMKEAAKFVRRNQAVLVTSRCGCSAAVRSEPRRRTPMATTCSLALNPRSSPSSESSSSPVASRSSEGLLAVGVPVWLLGAVQRHLGQPPGPLGQVLARSAFAAFVLQGPVLVGLAFALRLRLLGAEIDHVPAVDGPQWETKRSAMRPSGRYLAMLWRSVTSRCFQPVTVVQVTLRWGVNGALRQPGGSRGVDDSSCSVARLLYTLIAAPPAWTIARSAIRCSGMCRARIRPNCPRPKPNDRRPGARACARS